MKTKLELKQAVMKILQKHEIRTMGVITRAHFKDIADEISALEAEEEEMPVMPEEEVKEILIDKFREFWVNKEDEYTEKDQVDITLGERSMLKICMEYFSHSPVSVESKEIDRKADLIKFLEWFRVEVCTEDVPIEDEYFVDKYLNSNTNK